MKTAFLLLLTLVTPHNIKANVGGHDLFTSLAQLEVLWHNEHEIIKLMENAISKMERATKALKDYILSHKQLHLDEKPNYEFLGHPINAYHFVRHVASRWKDIQNEVIGNETIRDDLNHLAERENEKLPNEYDVQGGAYGIGEL